MTVDYNANLGRWPFRRLPLEEAANYAVKAKALGITQAWMGSLEGVFHQELRGVNQRLARACQGEKSISLLPAVSINPALPDWQEDLRLCKEELGVKAIRLHPNYHGYNLSDESFHLLLAKAQGEFQVQIVLRMEDERTQHPLMRVAPVDLKPLEAALIKAPLARVQVLNGMQELRGELGKSLARTGRVFFDWAMLEGAGGLEKAAANLGEKALLLGTHAPLFHPESAILKLKESSLRTLGMSTP
ncbi:MAG: metal-dependent hydrolase [Gemmataceae bacterium]|nr:metal-dependent hydrolase [Gemmataceae bacterium]